MNSPHDKWRQQESLYESKDPCEINPFGQDNPRHAIWEWATREATAKDAKLRSTLAGLWIQP